MKKEIVNCDMCLNSLTDYFNFKTHFMRGNQQMSYKSILKEIEYELCGTCLNKLILHITEFVKGSRMPPPIPTKEYYTINEDCMLPPITSINEAKPAIDSMVNND